MQVQLGAVEGAEQTSECLAPAGPFAGEIVQGRG